MFVLYSLICLVELAIQLTWTTEALLDTIGSDIAEEVTKSAISYLPTAHISGMVHKYICSKIFVIFIYVFGKKCYQCDIWWSCSYVNIEHALDAWF